MVSDSDENFSKEKGEILQWSNSKVSKRTIRVIWLTKKNLKEFQPNSLSNSNTGSPKDKGDSNTEAMGKAGESATAREACNACQASRDELTAMFTAILNQNNAANMPTRIKVTSRAAGIKAMTPFDWTTDKAIYQRVAIMVCEG